VAIAQYSNLRPSGKGAFHKAAIRSPVLPGLLVMLGLSGLQILLDSYVSVFCGMAVVGVRSQF